ncbi:MAG: asparagine synthase (glutamine-hydrolyzing) [Alphaproteobacteria bacterium 64-11]|nr:asparagine synthase (glutamine-hydrolyzing) [Alphaproteobacteria bacterium]OJU08111.1 MAG: asparagine synthase (glutamine-hydrolyzing) [Alphaproteobacteria bacterium 64-11]
MCGIAGLFDCRGRRPFAEGLIAAMTDTLVHRGPDGGGLYCAAGVALGHRRLAIIDLAGGAQPMQTQDGALTVVFNGEIYNFPELRAELEAHGARFVTSSDTEVLLHGWRQWGVQMLARLRGMFAFALWDSRDETLVLARDPLGKKPLHYALLADGTLAFASELKSLLCHSGLDRTLDNEAVSDFFTYGYVPDPKTIYRAARKLPPAHYLVVQRGSAPRIARYWNLLDTLDEAPRNHDPVEALLEHLTGAVGRRLISDVPLGALLSGGVDSGAVVALMAGFAPAHLDTFSIGFGERAFDESAYARTVSEDYGSRHFTQTVDADDFSLLPRLPEIYDEPFGDVSAIPTFAVCVLARRHVTVALTGDGGDEALAGYRRYRFHLLAGQARRWIPRWMRPALAAVAGRYPQPAWLPRPLRARATLTEWSLDPADAYVRMVSALPREVRAALLTPAFRESLDGYDSAAVVRDHFNVDAPLDPLQRAQYADVMTYLPGDILVKVDRASMANSLELRAPMLDQDFFAWAFAQTPQAKIAGVEGKAILKQAMEPYLPRDLLYRPKQGFTVPLAHWFRHALRDDILALAESPWLRESGMVETGRVAAMARAHVRGAQDHSKALWLVWSFDAFLRYHAPAGSGVTSVAAAERAPASPGRSEPAISAG